MTSYTTRPTDYRYSWQCFIGGMLLFRITGDWITGVALGNLWAAVGGIVGLAVGTWLDRRRFHRKRPAESRRGEKPSEGEGERWEEVEV